MEGRTGCISVGEAIDDYGSVDAGYADATVWSSVSVLGR